VKHDFVPSLFVPRLLIYSSAISKSAAARRPHVCLSPLFFPYSFCTCGGYKWRSPLHLPPLYHTPFFTLVVKWMMRVHRAAAPALAFLFPRVPPPISVMRNCEYSGFFRLFVSVRTHRLEASPLFFCVGAWICGFSPSFTELGTPGHVDCIKRAYMVLLFPSSPLPVARACKLSPPPNPVSFCCGGVGFFFLLVPFTPPQLTRSWTHRRQPTFFPFCFVSFCLGRGREDYSFRLSPPSLPSPQTRHGLNVGASLTLPSFTFSVSSFFPAWAHERTPGRGVLYQDEGEGTAFSFLPFFFSFRDTRAGGDTQKGFPFSLNPPGCTT